MCKSKIDAPLPDLRNDDTFVWNICLSLFLRFGSTSLRVKKTMKFQSSTYAEILIDDALDFIAPLGKNGASL